MAFSSANATVNQDPTRTKTIRRRYGSKLRGWLGKLNAVIRELIQSRDVFSINQQDPSPEGVFTFPTDDESDKVDEFMSWLRRQEENGLNRIIERDRNTFVRSSYERGLEHADQAAREAGIEPPEGAVENTFNLPVHQSSLQMLYTRNFEELQGITSDMNQAISRELAEGFERGYSPTKMARNVTDRVNKIGKTRATTLARTETIRAHSEATLNRFERMGVDGVTVKAEWSTAGDRRVCPICRALEGRTFTIQQARSETFSVEGSDYPMKPPAHPNCRCALIPDVTDSEGAESADTGSIGPVDREPRAEGILDEKDDADIDAIGSRQEYGQISDDREPYEILEDIRESGEERIDDVLSDTDVRIRASEDVISDIFDSGRFKTQFETNTSGGDFNPGWRKTFEEEWFGYDEDLDPSDRPVYGYLSDSGDDTFDQANLNKYGDAEIVLSDDVRSRTTFSAGDSLSDNGMYAGPENGRLKTVPSSVNDPDIRSFSYTYQRRLADGEFDAPTDHKQYTETQIHGGVDTDSIDEVIFRNEPSESVKNRLDEESVNWRVTS